MDITAEEFNDQYNVGTPVFVWPGWMEDEKGKKIQPLVSKTTTPAWEMPGGQQVVTIEGRAGGMWLHHVEVIPDYILPHIKSLSDDEAVRKAQAAQSRAETTLGLVGLEIESHTAKLLKSIAPYYRADPKTTTCDGKCAKVEDLEEELESARGATKVASRLADELLEKHLASEAKVAQLEEALASAQRRASEWEAETNKRGAEADRYLARAEAAEADSRRSNLEFRRLTEESAARMQEIERLRGVVRFNQQQHSRDAGTFAVYQGVIAKKEEELGEAAAKIDELRGMLNTQHGRLTVLEGDLGEKTRAYNNIEAKFVEARQKEDQLAEEVNKLQHERSCALTVINPKLDPFSSRRSLINETTELANRAEMLAADLADCQQEREMAYEMLDPNTEIDDRVASLPELVQSLVIEKNRLDREISEKPHAGCRQLEAGLQAKLTAAERGEEIAKEQLQVAEGSLEIYQHEAIRLARGWDGARQELQGLRMQVQSYEEAPAHTKLEVIAVRDNQPKDDV